MNNTFLKSTLILSIATLASKILGSIFRIPLQNIAGDEVLGIFSLVYPVYMVALTLSVAGIPVAISKLISEALVNEDRVRIYKIYRTATILTILFGLLSFTFIYSFSGPISNLLGGPSTRLSLIVVSATLLIAPYMAVYRGYFQGFQDMRPTAVSQVLEQFIRVGFILLIAYMLVKQNYSDEIVSGGVMAASMIGAFASSLYLLVFFKRSPLKPVVETKYTFKDFKKMGKTILVISLPICVGAITMALINFIDSMTIPMSLRSSGIEENKINYTYGIYSRGLALVQIATVFSSSIILPLIPLITKTIAENRKDDAKSIIERTHRLTHLVSWPAAFGLLALTLPLNLALFTNLEGSAVLAVIGFSAVFTSLTILGTGILQGMNLEKQAAYIIISGVIVKIVSNIVFIKLFGLIGAGFSTLFVYILIFLINTYFIWKKNRFTIWKWDQSSMVLSSIIMAVIIGIPTLFFDFESWSRTQALAYSFFAVIVGVFIYFSTLLMTKGINKNDILSFPFIKKILIKITPVKAGSYQTVGKGVKKMKINKKILIGFLIISFILTLPGIVNRFQVEWNNRTYEMVIPYENINELVRRDPSMDEKDVLTRLKVAGLQGVSLEPDSLESLEHKGIISIFTNEEIKEMSLFDPDFKELLQDGFLEGLFVLVHEKTEETERLSSSFDQTKEIIFKGKEMILVPGVDNELLELPLGYSKQTIDLIREVDLSLILRVPNVEIDESSFQFEQVLQLADEKTDRILFLGKEVIGNPRTNLIKEYALKLKDNGFGVYAIEFEEQGGFATLSKHLGMDVIRLHSLDLKEVSSIEVGVDRAVRAVKERNIRSLFIKMKMGEDISSRQTLENTETLIFNTQKEMPTLFHLGKAAPFEQINVPIWSQVSTLLAAILFVSMGVLKIVQRKWMLFISIAGLGAVSLAYLVLQNNLLIQGIALLVALITPVLAIIPTKGKENRGIIPSYMNSVLISFVGIAIVIALLNGNEYLVKISEFRGVKLIYVFPIAFMFIYAIWGSVKMFLTMNVKYWHLLALFITAVVVLYYISRTGNQGSVSTIELTIRQFMDDLLYARPRTKEFLIGFPLYVLALYFMPINKKLALFLLIPGVIGFLSIVNTFTHLHIPLYVSLLRTFYSLVLGLIIGYILIFIYKKGLSIYMKFIKPRWFS